MDLYRRVRLACHHQGMSIRAASRQFGISRETVSKMLKFSEPPGYRRRSVSKRPKLDGFTDIIDGYIEDDKLVPRKQRHTSKRIFDRLKDEHNFTGGYTTIKDYVRTHHQRHKEVFVPLSHAPGHGQADFGEAQVIIAGVLQKAHFFVLDLPHSDACYVRAYPRAVTEAWLDGHNHAFVFFGAVPQSILYDNDKCLVARIQSDGIRKRTAAFSGFLSHYLIKDRYGRPGKGNDKGKVEGMVGYTRRNYMVPTQVEMPPRLSHSSSAILLKIRCMILPERVLGKHVENCNLWMLAMGPVYLRAYFDQYYLLVSYDFSVQLEALDRGISEL